MNYLDGLNQGQLDSVRTTEGRVACLPGQVRARPVP